MEGQNVWVTKSQRSLESETWSQEYVKNRRTYRRKKYVENRKTENKIVHRDKKKRTYKITVKTNCHLQKKFLFFHKSKSINNEMPYS